MNGGGQEKLHPCFRCGRTKPDCSGERNYNHDKKADGSEVNPKEVIDELFKEKKEARRNRRKEIGGSQQAMDSEVVPEWTKTLADEQSHDSNLMVEWSFVQDGLLSKCKLNHSKKEVIYDLKDETDHVYNQSESMSVIDERMWRLLLNSQSICNVIINK